MQVTTSSVKRFQVQTEEVFLQKETCIAACMCANEIHLYCVSFIQRVEVLSVQYLGLQNHANELALEQDVGRPDQRRPAGGAGSRVSLASLRWSDSLACRSRTSAPKHLVDVRGHKPTQWSDTCHRSDGACRTVESYDFSNSVQKKVFLTNIVFSFFCPRQR